MDPQLEASLRESSGRTIETAGRPVNLPAMAGSGAAQDVPDAGSDEPTPVPLDPQPAEPAPLPDDEADEDFERSQFSDDSVRCGNGVLDGDELCDFTIPEGEPGSCPTAESCEDESDDPCYPWVLEVHGCWSQCVRAEPDPGQVCP